MRKSYRELICLPTFKERYDYLRLCGRVGHATFGFDRYLNQAFYRSREWKRLRNDIIVRDESCDLAMPGHEIFGRVIIHHINPISPADIERSLDCVFDPDNLICTSHQTSNAIHYGDASLLAVMPEERRRGDTTLWTAY